MISGCMIAKTPVEYSMCGLRTCLYFLYQNFIHGLFILLCEIKHYHTIILLIFPCIRSKSMRCLDLKTDTLALKTVFVL